MSAPDAGVDLDPQEVVEQPGYTPPAEDPTDPEVVDPADPNFVAPAEGVTRPGGIAR